MKKLLPYRQGVAATLFVMLLGPGLSQHTLAKAWNGSVSSDWNDPDNWSPRGVPSGSDNINFFLSGGPTTTIHIDSGTVATAKSFDVYLFAGSHLIMTIDSGASLTLNGGGTESSGLAVRLFSGAQAEITNHGVLALEEYTSRNVYLYNQGDSSIVFTNHGTMSVSDCGTYAMHIDVNGAAVSGAFNEFRNTGTLQLSHGTQYAMYLSGYSGRPCDFINEGDVLIEEIDYIAYANSHSGFTQTASGTTQAEGILKQIGSVNLEGRYETSSTAPGTISLEVGGGSTTFDLRNATFDLVAEGTAGKGMAGGNDFLNILGKAMLQGTNFHITFEGGYVPSVGDSYEFFAVSDSLIGTPSFHLPAAPAGATYEMTMVGGSFFLEVSSAPFPVEMVYFSGAQIGNEIVLSWETASEDQNSGFYVQRSSDALGWQNIAFVEGAGTTTGPRSYQYIDRHANSGKTLYRLQQWDLDGQVHHSNVVELVFTKDLSHALRVYPIPAKTTLTVAGVPGHIRILNHLGQTLADHPGNDGAPIEFDISSYPDGLYYVQVETMTRELVWSRWQK